MNTKEQALMILIADLLIRHEPEGERVDGAPMCPVCRVAAPCGIYLEAERLIDTVH